MRHAEAIPPQFWTNNDVTRPLTDLSQAQLVGVCEAMKKINFKPACVLASPFERTKETAHLLFEGDPHLKPVLIPELASGARAGDFQKSLRPYNNKDEVLIVGHMPDVAVAAARFTDDAQLMEMGFSAGEMMAIQIPSVTEWGNGKVLWRRQLEEWKTLTI